MSKFDKAYKFTSAREGGVANVKGDRGGYTAYGISSKYHPEFFEGVKDIHDEEEMRPKVKDFYLKNYWNALRCDELPLVHGVWLHDVGVNSGRTGIRHFQEACETAQDGVIGNNTISAANAIPAEVINDRMVQIRSAFYRRLADQKDQEKFLRGWLNRASLCHDYCADLLDNQ